jgi:hypothetical protein
MRPVRIIATVVVVATLAVTSCSAGTADQTAAPGSSAPSSVPTTQLTAAATTQTTAASAGTTTTVRTSAKATCVLSPNRGPAGARVLLSCRGFAPAERVAVTFGAAVLAAAKATASGQVAASFPVPSGFAGSHYPGRRDTFQAKGRQSGTVASATFTVTG